jgi:hypothetical protein
MYTVYNIYIYMYIYTHILANPRNVRSLVCPRRDACLEISSKLQVGCRMEASGAEPVTQERDLMMRGKRGEEGGAPMLLWGKADKVRAGEQIGSRWYRKLCGWFTKPLIQEIVWLVFEIVDTGYCVVGP